MFFNLAILFLALASKAFADFNEAARNVQPMIVSDNLVVYNSTTKSDTIYFSYLQYNGIPSVRIQANTTKRTADFRLIFVRLIEFSPEIPIGSSNSTYEFEGKGAWSPIKVSQFTETYNKKTVNILRMNSTFVHCDFQFNLNLFTSDRACFYGSYNLDPDAVYIVPTIINFPYKYQNSSVAIEQIVASSDSGQVSSFLNVLESPFLGSLVISPNAYDTTLGQVPVVVSDFNQVDFTVNTGNKTRESEYQQMYVGIGSTQQPKNVSLEEKFSVNLKAVAKEGYILTSTAGASPTGSDNGGSTNGALSMSPNTILVAAIFGLSMMMLFY